MEYVSYIVSPTVVRVEFIPQKEARIKWTRSWLYVLENELSEALSDYGPVRLIFPDPGTTRSRIDRTVWVGPEKGTIAVEVPRTDRQIVRLREALESKEFQESKAHLPIALGIDSKNNIIVADLARMPHLLISGACGQGKSILMKNIILSLIYRFSPDDLKLVLIDPKQMELVQFNVIKNQYLLQTDEMSPGVIIDIEKVPTILRSIDYEVEYRYDLLRVAECRTIYEYNQKFADGKLSKAQHHHLPYIIVVIDEFADLMKIQGHDFEIGLVRIAMRSRAVGIHVVIASQCFKKDVCTDVIRVNYSSRIAFKVSSIDASRIIIDYPGAEKILGMGDMLFTHNSSINRIQSCFVDTEEIESICDWIAKELPNDTSFVLPTISDPNIYYKPIYEGRDPLFEEAALFIVATDMACTSIQRRFNIGYPRACLLMNQLEKAGIVGPQNGGKPRKILKPENQKRKSLQRLINLLRFGKKNIKDDIDKNDTMSFEDMASYIDIYDTHS